tara:strand:+ start:214 stop:1806 length:1593 start_codon:yes stop_codon:yes gene_type:complete
MGDLSDTVIAMEGERILIDSLNRRFRVKSTVPLSQTPPNLSINRKSKPWNVYFSMVATVLPAFFLMYASLFIILGFVESEPVLTLSGAMCSLPLTFLLFRLHRPRIIHVRLASPDENGSTVHALPEGGSLQTPTKTNFSRFLVKEDSILETPPSGQLWFLFSSTVTLGLLLTSLFLFGETVPLGNAMFLMLAIPLWLVGFSLPVLAWWGSSTSSIGMPTKRREAESWLIAGMASAFPAFFFNSLVAPAMIPSSFPDWAIELCILALSAPFFEEIFKALAVALFIPAITGPKKGFQVGFTVGLGFALIENFQYIGYSLIGGPLSITITILVRGIGSIPGHAVWTAISGCAIGWMATESDFKSRLSWRAKKAAIGTVDLIESMGIDLDGDGDLSGFDGERRSLEEEADFIEENTSIGPTWLTEGANPSNNQGANQEHQFLNHGFGISYDSEAPFSDLRGIRSPKSIKKALAIAILGHALWNGSSYASYVMPQYLGMSDSESGLISLIWTVILILSILAAARSLMNGVKSLEN